MIDEFVIKNLSFVDVMLGINGETKHVCAARLLL